MYTKESVDKGRKERLVIDQTRNQSNLETRLGNDLVLQDMMWQERDGKINEQLTKTDTCLCFSMSSAISILWFLQYIGHGVCDADTWLSLVLYLLPFRVNLLSQGIDWRLMCEWNNIKSEWSTITVYITNTTRTMSQILKETLPLCDVPSILHSPWPAMIRRVEVMMEGVCGLRLSLRSR